MLLCAGGSAGLLLWLASGVLLAAVSPSTQPITARPVHTQLPI